ncbi:hypothetical protein [Enterovirga aerilata]|uniref:Uncharacterized protein n=1 Tax=Enterovirga aerilata TaxID=2730920 RepID=A0A849I5P1_9HYPH|nr:hypothetical protein [Enterovirga sp. DB1703]NNM74782.1 hypothetical protein [Enterovirga sp. DB1703]
MHRRPVYETAADRESEKDFARWLAAKYFPSCHVEKLSMAYRVDFAVYSTHDGVRPRYLRCFVEYKDRSRKFAWADFEREGVYRISLNKLAHAALLCERADVPFYLAVKVKDGTYIARLTPARMATLDVCHDGRKDRRVRCPDTGEMIFDPADMEPMIEVPVSLFEKAR